MRSALIGESKMTAWFSEHVTDHSSRFSKSERADVTDPTVREFADSVIDLQDAVIEFDLLDYLTETDPLSD